MTPEGTPDIVVQPTAEADISGAFRWYEDRDEGLGSEFMRALDATLAAIQRTPTGYAAIHKQVRRAMLRRFPYGVFYLSENEKIIVIACLHDAPRPSRSALGRRAAFRPRCTRLPLCGTSSALDAPQAVCYNRK